MIERLNILAADSTDFLYFVRKKMWEIERSNGEKDIWELTKIDEELLLRSRQAKKNKEETLSGASAGANNQQADPARPTLLLDQKDPAGLSAKDMDKTNDASMLTSQKNDQTVVSDLENSIDELTLVSRQKKRKKAFELALGQERIGQ